MLRATRLLVTASGAAAASDAASAPLVAHESLEAVQAADLRYVTDRMPGIARRRAGKGFVYVDADGRRIQDENVLVRIRRLAIPPAWTQVWICADPNGHIQAIGKDARGRKQYRYHARWREVRDETKFANLLAFGRALPAIRRQVRTDLARPGMPLEKVLAAIVRLMEHTHARVGNAEYARQNRTYGLTTLRNRHVRVRGSQIRVRFRGKHGIIHDRVLHDPTLAKIIRNCSELPGEELFQFLDADEVARTVSSQDVNDYLRRISGCSISAKDFRTWAATRHALREALDRCGEGATQKSLKQIVACVAERMGNTPSVCRSSYIHPRVFDAYLAGHLAALRGQRAERVLMRLLRRRR